MTIMNDVIHFPAIKMIYVSYDMIHLLFSYISLYKSFRMQNMFYVTIFCCCTYIALFFWDVYFLKNTNLQNNVFMLMTSMNIDIFVYYNNFLWEPP